MIGSLTTGDDFFALRIVAPNSVLATKVFEVPEIDEDRVLRTSEDDLLESVTDLGDFARSPTMELGSDCLLGDGSDSCVDFRFEEAE